MRLHQFATCISFSLFVGLASAANADVVTDWMRRR